MDTVANSTADSFGLFGPNGHIPPDGHIPLDKEDHIFDSLHFPLGGHQKHVSNGEYADIHHDQFVEMYLQEWNHSFNDVLVTPMLPALEHLKEHKGNAAAIQKFYEGRPTCKCCINWVEKEPTKVPEEAKEKYDGVAIRMYHGKDHNKQTLGGLKDTSPTSIVIQSPIILDTLEPMFKRIGRLDPMKGSVMVLPPFQELFFAHADIMDAYSKCQSDTHEEKHLGVLKEVIDDVLRETTTATRNGIIIDPYACPNSSKNLTQLTSENPKFEEEIRIHFENGLSRARPSKERIQKNREIVSSQPQWLLLLDLLVAGYSLANYSYKKFYVNYIRDVKWNDWAFERLVFPNESKDMLLALVQHHRTIKDIGQDIIQGKGNGFVALLSGPPGTGKTLTAEAVADQAKRPFLRIQAETLGWDEDYLEEHLEEAFKLAEQWDALLLIDEADAYLGSDRGPNERSSLVRTSSYDFAQTVDLTDQDYWDLARWELNGRELKNAVKVSSRMCYIDKDTLSYKRLEIAIRHTAPRKFVEPATRSPPNKKARLC
ncbi:hypothetical protein SLS60_011717 [Paraconiothyrium brasiliense]|uniref:AAA+ ATPase domain-containing protein n=1 Tax=Paraconiothyrium brasiliense TaxID=300254 RepID=A0ABR3QI52_9PLEO